MFSLFKKITNSMTYALDEDKLSALSSLMAWESA